MAVSPQKDRLVTRSIVTHLRTALGNLGWTNTDDWVVIGNLNDNPDADRPPVVAVDITEDVQTSFELGNSNRLSFFTVDIELWGKNNAYLKDLKNCVQRSLYGDIIVYDENDSAIGRISPQDTVSGNIVDPINYHARVSCVMRENQPIVI